MLRACIRSLRSIRRGMSIVAILTEVKQKGNMMSYIMIPKSRFRREFVGSARDRQVTSTVQLGPLLYSLSHFLPRRNFPFPLLSVNISVTARQCLATFNFFFFSWLSSGLVFPWWLIPSDSTSWKNISHLLPEHKNQLKSNCRNH
jgi:hypothetical protein